MAEEKAGIKIDDTVDITDVVCPVTFVKAKVALEELDEGQILSVHMNDGEPVQNVPRSVKEEGHQILKLIDNEDGTYDLIVRKMNRWAASCCPSVSLSPVTGFPVISKNIEPAIRNPYYPNWTECGMIITNKDIFLLELW